METLEGLRIKIGKIEKQIEDTEDQAQKTALISLATQKTALLVALLQRENLLLQGERFSEACKDVSASLSDFHACSTFLIP